MLKEVKRNYDTTDESHNNIDQKTSLLIFSGINKSGVSQLIILNWSPSQTLTTVPLVKDMRYLQTHAGLWLGLELLHTLLMEPHGFQVKC